MPTASSAPGTLLVRLDEDTQRHHASAIRPWLELAGGAAWSRADYERQLAITYGFEAPYEAACTYTPGLAQAIQLRGRWRSGWIARDLLALGRAPEDLTQIACCSIAPFYDPAEALGWMYVVEQVATCHPAVRHAVSRRAELSHACAYLGAQATAPHVRRAELGLALDRVCTTPHIARRVVESAHDAYCAWIDWQAATAPRLRITG